MDYFISFLLNNDKKDLGAYYILEIICIFAIYYSYYPIEIRNKERYGYQCCHTGL